MNAELDNFVVIDSIYGRFIVNRYCHFQAEALVKTGRTHIEGELNNMRAIVSHLPDGCLVLDGGANIDFVAVPLAQVVAPKKGVVIAFEPQRMIFNALAGTIALNGLENLYAHQQALGEKADTAFLPPVDYGKSADFGMVQLSDKAVGEPVSVVAIDELRLGRLDFFKLDVEGYELAVLRGARRTLEAFEPWCWVEYWKTGKEPIMKCFEGLRYRFYVMDQLNLLCVPESRYEKLGGALKIQAQEARTDA